MEPDECPLDGHIPECSSSMTNGQLCEADKTLPDGNRDYNVNNCGGSDNFDIWKCERGTCFKNIRSSFQ